MSKRVNDRMIPSFTRLKNALNNLVITFEDNSDLINSIMISLLCVYVATVMLDSSVLIASNVYVFIVKLVRYFIYFICFLYSALDFFSSRGSKGIPINYLILVGIVLIVFVFSRNQYIVIFTLLIYTFRNISFDEIVKNIRSTTIIVFSLLIILSAVNILPDWTYARDYQTVRHSLGFFYSTILSTSYLFIMMLDFYTKKKAIAYIDILYHVLVSSLVYLLSCSRTGFILCIVMAIIMIVNKKITISLDKGWIKTLLCISPFIMILLTVLSCIGYYNDVPLFIKLNDILSDRLRFSIYGFREWNITMFGQQVKMYGLGGLGYLDTPADYHYNYIDNDYLQILFSYGLVYLLLLFTFYSKTIRREINNKNTELVIVLIANLVLSLIEPNIMKIGRNIFILTIGLEMFNAGSLYFGIKEKKIGIYKKERVSV